MSLTAEVREIFAQLLDAPDDAHYDPDQIPHLVRDLADRPGPDEEVSVRPDHRPDEETDAQEDEDRPREPVDPVHESIPAGLALLHRPRRPLFRGRPDRRDKAQGLERNPLDASPHSIM